MTTKKSGAPRLRSAHTKIQAHDSLTQVATAQVRDREALSHVELLDAEAPVDDLATRLARVAKVHGRALFRHSCLRETPLAKWVRRQRRERRQ